MPPWWVDDGCRFSLRRGGIYVQSLSHLEDLSWVDCASSAASWLVPGVLSLLLWLWLCLLSTNLFHNAVASKPTAKMRIGTSRYLAARKSRQSERALSPVPISQPHRSGVSS